MTLDRDPNAAYCQKLVRDSDLDRYLSTLLAEKDTHRALFAIYAFDADISNIAGQVSEPAIGEIRLQWWHDEIDAVYGGSCDNHPIARELQPVVHQHDLPKHLFTRIIDAHRFDIYRDPMASVEELVKYQTDTATSITDLACRVLIGYDALEVQSLTDKAGIAWGLGKMLRTLPEQTARKQCFLPADLLSQNQLSSKNVLAREKAVGIRLVVRQILHVLEENLYQLRLKQGDLKKLVLPAFFPAGLADANLKKLTTTRANLLTRTIPQSQLRMQWQLFKKSLFEKI